MKRERTLLGLLLVLVIAVGPSYLFDQLNRPLTERLTEVEQSAALERERAQAVRQAEDRLRELEVTAVPAAHQLLGDNPFADMEQALRMAAEDAGVRLERITLAAATAVEGVPGLLQYGADVDLAGSYDQYLAFLRALEENRLLIEVPDLVLALPSDGQGPLRTSLTLHFYRLTEAAQ